MTAYTMLAPNANVYTEWKDVTMLRTEPTARQAALIDIVQAALDEGMSYNSDLYPRCAALAGLTPEEATRNTCNVDGGDFSYEVYYARKAITERRDTESRANAHTTLDPHVGQTLGVLVFNDFKRTTGCTVTKVDGGTITLRGKRGAALVEFTTDARGILRAQERHTTRKGLRTLSLR